MTRLFHPPFAGFRRRCASQCFHQQTNSLLLVLVLCCFGKPTVASAQTWTSNGPEGGYIQALAIDPTTPATVYAGTPGGGVFKSTDGGASWAAVNSGLTNTNVFALAIAPTTPTTVYAGTIHGGVFKSTDGGASWAAVNSGLTNTVVQALEIDPAAPPPSTWGRTAAACSKAPTGGAWNAVSTSVIDARVVGLAIDPTTIPTTSMRRPLAWGSVQSPDGEELEQGQ
jgi:hypothetical protein